MIELGWLLAGWTRSSRAGFWLAGHNRTAQAPELAWLLSQNGSWLAGRDRVGLALGWLEVIELSWLSAGQM